MDLNQIKSVYFLGIGGIGMSALARYFKRNGVNVTGYDKTSTPLTNQLIREGIDIHFEEDTELIPKDVDLVVWTPAVPKEHAGYKEFMQQGIPVKKRSEVLGEITSQFTIIAVAGTHGKTTISTFIAHILRTAGKELMAFLGGISKNYGTNFIEPSDLSPQSAVCSPQSAVRSSQSSVTSHESRIYAVVEADEYDRSFLQLSPDIAIITSVDPDHLDIYDDHDKLIKTFTEFTGKIRTNGSLIIKNGIDIEPDNHVVYNRFTYALNTESNFFAKNIFIREGLIYFDFVTPTETIPGFVLGMPGMFNLENAIAALAVGYLTGIEAAELKSAASSFQGVERRFDIRIRRKDFIYIDDYAHHPEELNACIQAVRELYPGRQITGVFQPHLYSRTRDLEDDFAAVLSNLDNMILLEIYPAREQPIPGVSSEMLLAKIDSNHKQLCSNKELIGILEQQRPEVLLTLGAGDIDKLVEPITDAFTT